MKPPKGMYMWKDVMWHIDHQNQSTSYQCNLFAWWRDQKIMKELEAKDVLPNINRTQAVKRANYAIFVSVRWPLTFDLDLQTRPSEGPNTSFLWIWHRSIQRFWRFHMQTKRPQTDVTGNRTFCGSMCMVKTKKETWQRQTGYSLRPSHVIRSKSNFAWWVVFGS